MIIDIFLMRSRILPNMKNLSTRLYHHHHIHPPRGREANVRVPAES